VLRPPCCVLCVASVLGGVASSLSLLVLVQSGVAVVGVGIAVVIRRGVARRFVAAHCHALSFVVVPCHSLSFVVAAATIVNVAIAALPLLSQLLLLQ